MGTSLTGLTPSTTYDALIKVGDNGPITSTLKTLSDGLGNDLPMEASTTAINFTGTLTQSGTTLQPTLVSGTNIKTINGTSLLGSGNIPVVTSPSGVAGAIQFSNGSAFASDASNLFWDDTNNRLGIGTNAPSTTVDILPPTQTATATQFDCFRVGYSNSTIGVTNGSAFQVQVATTGTARYSTTLRLSGSSDTSQAYLKGFDSNLFGVMLNRAQSNLGLFSDNGIMLGNTAFAGSEGSASAMVHIKGSGSTSATTSLLVQNSAGTEALKVRDDLVTVCTVLSMLGEINTRVSSSNLDIYGQANGTAGFGTQIWGFTGSAWQETLKVVNNTNPSVIIGSTTYDASAKLKVDSTISGFLPPRMTTTQKNAIASPAAGLVVYDSTTNKLCCYDGSTWNDLF